MKFRIYTVEELLSLPVGTQFEHQQCGQCVIKQKGEQKYMSFAEEDFQPAGFVFDELYPWDVPMRMISLGEEE